MHTFESLMRVYRKEGFFSTTRELISYPLYYLYSLFRLNLKPRFSDVDAMLDFAFMGLGGLIAPVQIRSEFSPFMKIIKKFNPKTVLEIGTAQGGTLFAFTRAAAAFARIISLDLPQGMYGGGYQRWKIPLFRSFALPRQKLYLVRADSHQPSSLREVQEKFGGESIDFLFIDGDHSYDGVKRDFEMYSPLVKKGGIIAFHDIVPNPADSTCFVYKFWDEIKASFEHIELVESWKQNGAGIGLIYRN